MGVCEAAAKRSYDVLVATIAEDDISVLKRIVSNQKVDGILLTRSLVLDYPADFLKNARVPFVTVGSSSDPNIVQVDTDTRTACRNLTRETLQKSKTRVALILGPVAYIVNQDRLDGFTSAFQAAGKPVEDALVIKGVTGGKAVKEAVMQAVAAEADCILCGDDFICAKAAEQLLASGVTGVRISSFYNSDVIRDYSLVDSVVNVDVRSYGFAAGETLIKLLEHEPVEQKTYVSHSILHYH